RNAFEQEGKNVEVKLGDEVVTIEHVDFESKVGYAVLDGSDGLNCKTHQLEFISDAQVTMSEPIDGIVWDINDNDITCNKYFQYHIIYPNKNSKYNDVILFFHGLNERKWDKYLPWATSLAKSTG